MTDCVTIPHWIATIIHWRNSGVIDHNTLINAIEFVATKIHVIITHGNGDCIIN